MNRVRVLYKDEIYQPVSFETIKQKFKKKAVLYKTKVNSLGYNLNCYETAIEPANWIVKKYGNNTNKAYILFEQYKSCMMKDKYIGENINDPIVNENSNNIRTFSTGDPNFNEKLLYYKNLIATTGYQYPEGLKRTGTNIDLSGDFSLEDYVKYRGPVVVAQEFYGCGAKCLGSGSKIYDTNNSIKFHENKNVAKKYIENNLDYLQNDYELKIGEVFFDKEAPQYQYQIPIKFKTEPNTDIYNDRITKIHYVQSDNKIVIQEFNRANVNISMKYWENLIDVPGHFKSKSTQSFVFDFIRGYFSLTKKDALFLFDSNLFELLLEDNEGDDEAIDLLNVGINKFRYNNFPSFGEIAGGYFDDLRKATNIDGGEKIHILIHNGGEAYTSSQGCLTIYEDDYSMFMSTFQNNKLGLAFLFRDEL